MIVPETSSGTRRSTRRRPSRCSPSSRPRQRRRSSARRCSPAPSRDGCSASSSAWCARRVLEIGTFSGYSALSMADGLPDGGRIDTSRSTISGRRWPAATSPRSRYADRITVHVGPAIETISQARRGVRLRLHRRRQDGLHRLLRGRVAPALRARSDRRRQHAVRRTRGRRSRARDRRLQRARAVNDPRVESASCSPFRDGVTLIRRRS